MDRTRSGVEGFSADEWIQYLESLGVAAPRVERERMKFVRDPRSLRDRNLDLGVLCGCGASQSIEVRSCRHCGALLHGWKVGGSECVENNGPAPGLGPNMVKTCHGWRIA